MCVRLSQGCSINWRGQSTGVGQLKVWEFRKTQGDRWGFGGAWAARANACLGVTARDFYCWGLLHIVHQKYVYYSYLNATAGPDKQITEYTGRVDLVINTMVMVPCQDVGIIKIQDLTCRGGCARHFARVSEHVQNNNSLPTLTNL